jgi:hypothetical protein
LPHFFPDAAAWRLDDERPHRPRTDLVRWSAKCTLGLVMNDVKSLVAAAVLGILAGSGCAGQQPRATSAQPPDPQAAAKAAAASDKHACGGHDGAGCGAAGCGAAVPTPPK